MSNKIKSNNVIFVRNELTFDTAMMNMNAIIIRITGKQINNEATLIIFI